MKLNLQHMHLLTTVIILSTTPGAYSQISFADMVDKAKAKFYDSTVDTMWIDRDILYIVSYVALCVR